MAKPSDERERRRRQTQERWRLTFDRIVSAIEALDAAGLPARLVLPLHDDRAIEILVEAAEMPIMSQAARLLRRSLSGVPHTILFTGDLPPDRLAALQGMSWDLHALRHHRQGMAA